MISFHVFMAMSLDGFIARPDGGLDWLTPYSDAGEDHGYDAFLAPMDGIVMGRGTFETVMTFPEWPYEKPVVVLSRSGAGEKLPAHAAGRARILALSPQALASQLAAEGWRRVYLDGGQLVQAFLREGLVEDLIITRVPILLGEGRPLFGSLRREIALHHEETKAFPSGLVQSRYRVRRAEG